jgi:hypothetical protein
MLLKTQFMGMTREVKHFGRKSLMYSIRKGMGSVEGKQTN